MDITQQLVNALWLGSMYSLFALGYALVFSVLGLLNLAHSAVFMWGAYFGWVLGTNTVVNLFGGDLSLGPLALPLWVVIPAAMLGAGLLSVAVDLVAFRPLRQRDAPRIAQLISSIGVSIFLVSMARVFFETQPKRFPPNETLDTAIQVEGLLSFRVTPVQIFVFIASLVLMLLLGFLIRRTKQGQAMRTVAFNRRIAALLGVPVDQVFRLTFFLAGALAGAAGVLYGLAYPLSILPDMGDAVGLTGLIVIVLGGMGSIEGAVLGGFMVAGVEVFSVALGSSDMRQAILFVLLFIILIVRPQGLIGQRSSDRA